MRRLAILASLLASAALRAETPRLLSDAIHTLIVEDQHWAYTQKTEHLDRSGKTKGEPTVERYDPSKPYNEQWALIEYQGHKPTDSQARYWLSQKEQEVKRRNEKTLGDVLDLDRATLVSETPADAIFLVPIQKDASKRFPADKLEVYMTVDKSRHALTSFSLRPREPFRYAAVLKVESGYVDGRLDVVKKPYAPTLVWAKGSGQFRLLGLFKLGIGREVTYTNFARVTPYNDRFTVRIGDVKALDF